MRLNFLRRLGIDPVLLCTAVQRATYREVPIDCDSVEQVMSCNGSQDDDTGGIPPLHEEEVSQTQPTKALHCTANLLTYWYVVYKDLDTSKALSSGYGKEKQIFKLLFGLRLLRGEEGPVGLELGV